MKDNQNKTCSDCGGPFREPPKLGEGGASGYATLPDGNRICYACADKREIEELKDRSKPFVGYVGKKDEIITWTGGHLMKITRAWPVKHNMSNDMLSIHAVDVHGKHWFGRGREGFAITMRPCKS